MDMEKTLEKGLQHLGDQVEKHIEEWRTAESARRSELEQTIKSLEDEIGSVKEALSVERRGHLPGVEVAANGERDAFSMARACRALARKDFRDAPYEQEVFTAMKEKAMSQGTDTAGGYIVPEEAITQVIERLKAQVVAYDLGARDMTGNGVPVTIPKLTTSATGYWVSENATITASDLGFEQINMVPKTVAGRVILSNLLLETSTPTADSIIEQDLASQLGLAVDAGVLNGSAGGGAGEPVGIMQTSGVSIVDLKDNAGTSDAAIGSPPGLAGMMEFLSDLDNANALRGRLGWCVHPLMMNEIRQMQTNMGGTDTPLTAVSTSTGFADTLFGYPFRTSTQMTAPTSSVSTRSVLFGNWDDVMICRWGGLRLLASDTSDDAFSKDQTHVRATMRVDVALRHPESFSYADNT
jgi:HK97 family phage major capsid protein